MEGGKPPPVAPWLIASQAGSALVGPVVLGIVLDTQAGTMPWGILIGIGVGLLGSLTLLIQAAKRSG